MFTILLQQLSQFIYFIGSMKNTSFLKPLSKEKEREYLLLLKEKNDAYARDQLIEHNLRLVAHIVKKYDIHKETQDLISIGTIGLIKAVDSFQLEKGKLTAYASRCIENEILMHLRANKNHYNTLSLDDCINNDHDGNTTSLLDSLATPIDKSIEESITLEDDKQRLLRCFYVLDEKEKDIIQKRYGLNQCREYKQKEIAKEMHISRSYVSRIEKRALMKLYREYIKK
ncbi:MAG: sigma-70 family RNA polymerase sigma factor [Erysipelotrichia bacterium]|nr:sigma-70 family RNA polymerase sigma factor [Erysipelotrichia bacterium]